MTKPGFLSEPIFLAVVSIAVFLIALFLLRGPIRYDLVPLYVKTTYGGSIKQAYQANTKETNQTLAQFALDQRETSGLDCGEPSYEVLSESVGCYISGRSITVRPDAAYKDKWRATSLTLEQYLLDRGWHKEWNAQQPINEILDYHEESGGSIGVQYSKAHGGVSCSLSIMFLPDVYPTGPIQNDGELTAGIGCYRGISLFGGY